MAENNETVQAPENANLAIYNRLRSVPDEAKKAITDGRLRGKTDVNPMWRIKMLTETFGPCGFGWKVDVKKKWLEEGDTETVAAFVDIDLYVRDPKTGQWSEPIPGTGGNVFRRKEGSGKNYIDDDCFKKALTDAVSIATKFLGMAADVFYEKDPTSKYETDTNARQRNSTASQSGTAAPAAKPRLDKNHPAWLKSVTIAQATTDDVKTIRTRIEKKFVISDEDFNALMAAAGKTA